MADVFIPRHGGQLRELAAEFDLPETSLIDFSASINPLPPSGALVNTLCEQIRAGTTLTVYPDPDYTALKQGIAKYVQVDAPAIAVGNGVMPLLDAVVRCLGLRSCLVPVPSFSEYRRVFDACGAKYCILRGVEEEDFAIDAGRVIAELKATRAQAVLLANPHSPSGGLMSVVELSRLCEAAFALGATTIVDEAFIDYAPEESLSQAAEKTRGLVVLRSLTKFFSMPGMRVAYAIAEPGTRAAMESCLPAWPVASIAAEAARVAVEDSVSIAAAREGNARERAWLADMLRSLGLKVFPGRANYLLLKIDAGLRPLETWRRLIVEHRIVIRACANFEGLDERYFRVGVRGHADNLLLVAALREALQLCR